MEFFTFIDSFFRGLGIVVEDLVMNEDNEGINIRIQTPDSALLIGMHGKNLEIITYFLSRILEKNMGEFRYIHLEVNDYMKEKDEKLFRFLDKKIELLREIGGDVALEHLHAYERKKAHSYIQSLAIEGLTSESHGERGSRVFELRYTGARTIRPTLSPLDSSPDRNDIDEEGIGI